MFGDIMHTAHIIEADETIQFGHLDSLIFVYQPLADTLVPTTATSLALWDRYETGVTSVVRACHLSNYMTRLCLGNMC